MSQNYWITNTSLATISASITKTAGWLNNVSLLAENVSKTVPNNLNVLSACVSNISYNYWTSKNTLDIVSLSLQNTTNWLNNVSMKSDTSLNSVK